MENQLKCPHCQQPIKKEDDCKNVMLQMFSVLYYLTEDILKMIPEPCDPRKDAELALIEQARRNMDTMHRLYKEI